MMKHYTYNNMSRDARLQSETIISLLARGDRCSADEMKGCVAGGFGAGGSRERAGVCDARCRKKCGTDKMRAWPDGVVLGRSRERGHGFVVCEARWSSGARNEASSAETRCQPEPTAGFRPT